jgi:transcriptional regulator with XRE-family HTH domain
MPVKTCQNPEMELKDVLQKLREDQGWTKAEAARQIGMERTQYLRMESGNPKRPEYETLVRIAEAYGVKPVVLIEAISGTVRCRCGR